MNRQKPYTLYIMLVLATLWIVFPLCSYSSFNPEATNVADRLQDISSTHLLGTDQLGRDVWSRILYGGKASLGIAFTIIGISGASVLSWWFSRILYAYGPLAISLIDLVLGSRIW